MHRRTVLKGLGSTVALPPLAGRVAAGTAQSKPYEPLGSVDVEGAREAVVGPGGKTAYVAATTGFATVDVGDPANPRVLAERRDLLADRDDGPLQQIYDVKVEGDRLVVAGPANGKRGEVVHGFLLYDVSDPKNPKRVAFHETEHAIHNAFVRDGVVYLTTIDFDTNPVVMVDVRDDSPTEVGRWSPLDAKPEWEEVDPLFRVVHDIWVQDGVGYFAYWDAGVWMADVSDPTNPEFVGHLGGVPREELASIGSEARLPEYVEPPGNAHYVTVNDDATLLGVGGETWDHPDTPETGGPSGIDLWDISTPAEAEKVATIEPERVPDDTMSGTWTTAHNFDFEGGRLYSSWYQGGVKLHDVSDPANPKQLAWWRKPSETSFWTARAVSEEFFVASSEDGQEGIPGALYTFPNRAGRQANPPKLGAPTTEIRTEAEPTTAASGARTTASAPTEREAMGTTRTAETEAPTSAAADSVTANGDGQPGFGALAALSGLALGAWRLRERDE